MKYEYGYTVCLKKESKTTVLGVVDDSGFQSKKAEIDYANKLDAQSSTNWFIRQVPDI